MRSAVTYGKNEIRLPKIKNIGFWFLLAIFIFAPRLPALDRFVTVDEATWVMRGANFYYALGQRDLENTVWAYHPAVTTMWAGTLGILAEFPEYRGQGQGYFIKEWKFRDFLLDYGHHPLEILKTSRLIIVFVNGVLLFTVFFLSRKLLGLAPAFVITLFLSYDPFLLGHTRILAHEGMMSLLLVISILAYLGYQEWSQKTVLLGVSAGTGALAALTKSSATIILLFIILLIILEVLNKKGSWSSKIKSQGRTFIVWFAIFSSVYIAIWPGMWVKPKEMLYQVYGNALSYAVRGENLTATESDNQPSLVDLDPNLSGSEHYLHSVLWRTTPTVWIGILLAIPLVVCYRKNKYYQKSLHTKIVFLVFGFFFLIMMSIAGGRRSSHYIMSTHASFDIVASLTLFNGVTWLRKWLASIPPIIPSIVLVGFISVHMYSSLAFFPYYFNYANPIMKQLEGIQNFSAGYGEGLDLAARYLAQKPDAKDMTVLSWYGFGPFSFFFPGETELLLPGLEWNKSLIDRLKRSDYLVVYYEQQKRRNMPAKLIHDILDVSPEHSIWLNGIEYVRIYKVSDLPDNVYVPGVAE